MPSERACSNSAPLQGGILKPPALRVVVDLDANRWRDVYLLLPYKVEESLKP